MCNNFPNIKVVEGNEFSLLLPLKVRTFESCRPIDEDIDPTQLSNIVFKFGGVSYTPIVDERGVAAVLPATLARGTYDIVLTADYGDNPIRAAYESAITIVPWNSQSDAQQYLPGSPIVLEAAYIIGGALTDAELEELKEEYREKNAQLDQAIADAEEAKREWEERAAELDGVAQEQTLTDGVTAIRDDISHIDIDTSDLAKQATLEEVKTIAQTSADAASIVNLVSAEVNNSKQNIIDLLAHYGVSADMTMSLDQLMAKVDSLVSFVPFGTEVASFTIPNNASFKYVNLSGIRVDYGTTWVNKFISFAHIESFIVGGSLYFPNCTIFSRPFNGCNALKVADLRGIIFNSGGINIEGLFLNCNALETITFGNIFDGVRIVNTASMFYNCYALQSVDIENITIGESTAINDMFNNCRVLVSLDLRHFDTSAVSNMNSVFYSCNALESLDLRGWSAASLTSTLNLFTGASIMETLVGDTTYEDVVANDIKIFDQYNVATNTGISSSPNLNRASLRAWINGLKDLTGQSAKTLILGNTLKNKLSAEDIAVATNKNWTIA